MMKRLSMLILIFILTFSLSNIYAQNEKTSLMINANLALPMNDYGKAIGTFPQKTRRFGFDFGGEVGLASAGYGLGVELVTPAFIDHLGWLISAKIVLNPTDDSEVNSYFQNVVSDTANLSIETGTWFHIPVMTGFSYGMNLMKDFNLYFSLQGGLNISQQASRKATINGNVVEETTFDTEIDFGFEAGLSLEFMNKYNVGVKYLNLGNPRYEGNRYLDDNYFKNAYLINNPIFGDERSIQLILITLGYRI